MLCPLKVVSAILDRNIHLISPPDPLAESRTSKKRISVCHRHHRQRAGVVGFCATFMSFYWMKNTTALPLVGDWLNTIYCGVEWLVVPLVIVCDLGAQAAYRDVFF